MKQNKSTLKLVTIGLVLLALAGCGSGKGSPETAAPDSTQTAENSVESTGNVKPFRIGFPWGTTTTNPTTTSILNNVKAAVESAGGELVIVESDMSADSLVNNVTDLISQGVDGIVFMPASDSLLPVVNQMCEEAGVYYSTIFRAITDDAIRQQIHASKYFAGSVNEDDVQCAYDVTKFMADQGISNLCVINIAQGDTSSDLRDAGIDKAVQETGIKLLNTTYNIVAQSEMTKTIESYVAAYPELDGIIIAGTYCPAALPTIMKSLQDNNLVGKVKVGRVDFEPSMAEYFTDGSIAVAYGGQLQIDPLLSTAILVNAVIGSPLNANAPTLLTANYLPLSSAKDAEAISEYFFGSKPLFTSEEIKNTMIKSYDTSISEATYVKIINDFTIESVLSRNQ